MALNLSGQPYLKNLLTLNRAPGKVKGTKAPHKPILLLAVVQLFEEGFLQRNEIAITPELVATFQKLWAQLVPEPQWQPRFFLPFFHLSGDGFWHLQLQTGSEIALTGSYSPKSLAALRDRKSVV